MNSKFGRRYAGTRARTGIGTAILIPVLAVALSSCATLRLQQPLGGPLFPAQEYLHNSRDSIDIGVRPLVQEDEYLRLFDDDLPKIGLVALHVEVRNSRPASVEINPSSWILRVGSRSFPALGAAKVFELYYSAHHIRMYSVATDRAARVELEQSLLNKGAIEPSGMLAGLVLFRIDPGMAAAWNRDATLVARDLIAAGRPFTLEVALTHADS